MLKIRPAADKDSSAILKILKELDLYYAALKLKGFWVVEKDNKVVGCVQLEEHDNFSFLGSLAVEAKEQKKGIGAQLMKEAIKSAKRDIYLYTIIPGFFERFGFKVCAARPDLPAKDKYECEDCHLERCVCMVKTKNQKPKYFNPMIPRYPQFKKLEFEDLDLLAKRLKANPIKICEFALANLFIWQKFDNPQVTCIHNNLCILLNPQSEAPFFLEPLGYNKLEETVGICLKHAGRICRAHESFVSLLPQDVYVITPQREHFDYIYRVSDLADLKGRKYDGKRNHIKKFKRHFPDCRYVSLTADLKKESLNLFEVWFAKRKETQFFTKLAYKTQRGALETAFDNFSKLKLLGGAILAEGKIKAFIVGSYLNDQTINVHFLYYDPNALGVSQTLLQEACQKAFSKYVYANLEQDLGIAGLRQYKLSYHPAWMERKFEVTKSL